MENEQVTLTAEDFKNNPWLQVYPALQNFQVFLKRDVIGNSLAMRYRSVDPETKDLLILVDQHPFYQFHERGPDGETTKQPHATFPVHVIFFDEVQANKVDNGGIKDLVTWVLFNVAKTIGGIKEGTQVAAIAQHTDPAGKNYYLESSKPEAPTKTWRVSMHLWSEATPEELDIFSATYTDAITGANMHLLSNMDKLLPTAPQAEESPNGPH